MEPMDPNRQPGYENRRPDPTGSGSQDELRSRVDLAIAALSSVTDLDEDARVRMGDVLNAAQTAMTALTALTALTGRYGDGASGAIGPGVASIDWSRLGSCSLGASGAIGPGVTEPSPTRSSIGVTGGQIVPIVHPYREVASANPSEESRLHQVGEYLVEFMTNVGDTDGVTRLGKYGYSESLARWGWTVDGVFVYDTHVRVVSEPIVRKETRSPGLYRIREGRYPVELADWDGRDWYRVGVDEATNEKVRVKLSIEPEVLGRHQRVHDEGHYWILVNDDEPVIGYYGSSTFLQGQIRVLSPPAWTVWRLDEEVADETVRVVSGRLVPPVIPSGPTGAVGLTG